MSIESAAGNFTLKTSKFITSKWRHLNFSFWVVLSGIKLKLLYITFRKYDLCFVSLRYVTLGWAGVNSYFTFHFLQFISGGTRIALVLVRLWCGVYVLCMATFCYSVSVSLSSVRYLPRRSLTICTRTTGVCVSSHKSHCRTLKPWRPHWHYRHYRLALRRFERSFWLQTRINLLWTFWLYWNNIRGEKGNFFSKFLAKRHCVIVCG